MTAANLPDIPEEPLDIGWRPTASLQIPAEMILAAAQGLEDEAAIAERFGFRPENIPEVLAYPPYKLAVAAKKAELEKNGWVFRQKAAMQAEILMDSVFVQAMSHETGLGMKLETLKYLSKMGNLEPKEEKAAANAPTAVFQINFDGQNLTMMGMNAPKLPTGNVVDVLGIPVEDE